MHNFVAQADYFGERRVGFSAHLLKQICIFKLKIHLPELNIAQCLRMQSLILAHLHLQIVKSMKAKS